ncbi:MAG TPA: hypothetical protein PKA59_03965, partial [Chakrabartia sp.]|nr:hypothetical protein [Chakrabartia sp.]
GGDVIVTTLTRSSAVNINAANAAGIGTAVFGGTLNAIGDTLTAGTIDNGGLFQTVLTARTGAMGLTTVNAGTLGVSATGGPLTFTSLQGQGAVGVNARTAAGGNIISTSGGLTLGLAGNSALGAVRALNGLTATLGGDLSFDEFSAGGVLDIEGRALNGNLASSGLGRLRGDDGVVIRATSILAGPITALRGSIALTTTGLITAGPMSAANDINVDSVGDVTLDTLSAGDDVRILGDGSIQIGLVTTSSTGTDSEADGRNIVVSGGSLTLAGANSAGNARFTSSAGIESSGSITSQGDTFVRGNSVSLIDVSAGGNLSLTAVAGGRVAARSLTGANGVDLAGQGGVFITQARATGGSITVQGNGGGIEGQSFIADLGGIALTATGGTLDIGRVQARNGLVFIDNEGDVSASDVFGQRISIGSRGSISTGVIGAGSDVNIGAAGDVDLEAVNAGGNVRLDAGLALSPGNVDAGGSVVANGTTMAMDGVVAGDRILLVAGSGGLTAGALRGGGAGIEIDSLGDAILGTITATTGGVTARVDGPFASDAILASTGRIRLVSTMGDMTTGNLTGTFVATDSAGTTRIGNVRASAGDISLISTTGLMTGSISAPQGSAFLSNQGGPLSTGAITVLSDFTLNSGSDLDLGGIAAGDDIRITSTGLARYGRLISSGEGTDNEGDGGNISLTSVGTMFVDHAEAGRTFSASAASFSTGPATIITGGDIIISAPGDIDLGESQAGGFISANAGGALNFGTMTSGASSSLVAGTSLTGTQLTAGGGISLRSGGTTLVDRLVATGTYVPTSGPVPEGNVFVIAGGIASVNAIDAATSIGVRGSGVSANGLWRAGEDIYSVSLLGAALGTVSAGDDVQVIAASGITLTDATARGTARDNRGVQFNPGGGSVAVIPPSFSLFNTTPFGAELSLSTGTSAPVTARNLTAANDIFVGGGTVTVTGQARTLGIGLIGTGSDITINGGTADLANVAAFTNLRVNTSGNQTLGPVTTGGLIRASSANGGISFASLGAGTTLDVIANNGTVTGSGASTAGSDLTITARALSIGDATSGGRIRLDASAGSAVSGNLTAASVGVSARDTIRTLAIRANTGSVALSAINGMTTGNITALLGSAFLGNSNGTLSTGFITVGDDFTLNTGSVVNLAGVTAGDDISVTTSMAADFGRLIALGGGTDNESDGANITLSSTGPMFVDHAEARNDFRADAGRFETGPNTIITGGNIIINAPGDILLGNSQAGGYIDATSTGGLISFGTMTAGQFMALNAAGTLSGTSLTAGGAVTGAGNNGIAIDGITSGGDTALQTLANAMTLGTVSSQRHINLTAIGAGGLTAGTLLADGHINARSNGGVGITSAIARGTSLDPTTGIPVEGYIFIYAPNAPVTLGTGNAASMLGISGAGVSGTGPWVAGEDILILSGQGVNAGALTAGDDIDIRAITGVTLADAEATGLGRDDRSIGLVPPALGVGFLITAPTPPNGADITLSSRDAGITGTALTAGDDISLSAPSGALTFTGLLRTRGIGVTGGDSSISANGASAALGSADAFTDLSVTTTGPVQLGASLAGRDILISSGGATDYATLGAGRTISVQSGGVLTGTGAATAGNTASFTSLSTASLGPVSAGNDIFVDARADLTGGTFTTTGAAADPEADGRSIRLLSGGALTTGTITAFDDLRTTSTGNTAISNIRAGDDIGITAGGTLNLASLTATGTDGVSAVTIDAANGIAIDRTAITGTLGLTANSGAVLVATDLGATGAVNALGRSVSLTSLGALNLVSGRATAGDLTVKTGGALTIGTGSATGAVSFDAIGLLGIQGQVSGATISTRSFDIDIGASGQLGVTGTTTSLSLRNTGTRQTHIGGTGGTGTFGLSNAEAQRLHAGNIALFAPMNGAATGLSTRTPDVVLDTLDMSAGTGSTANLGTNGIFRIQTPGKLKTVGAVTLSNFGSGNRVELVASDMIEIDPATGSILLRDGSTGLAGTLRLESDNVAAASTSAIADILGALTTKAISDRLGRNDGDVNDEGVLRANTLDVSVGSSFYIQNTGVNTPNPRAFDARRGFTVGSGGLQITTLNAETIIAINGRQQDGLGGFITGLQFIPLARFTGGLPSASLFDIESTINGCGIINPALCNVGLTATDVAKDTIERAKESRKDGNIMPLSIIDLKGTEEVTDEPVLDDPVTGSGNDDFWSIDDDKEEREKAQAKQEAAAPAAQ